MLRTNADDVAATGLIIILLLAPSPHSCRPSFWEVTAGLFSGPCCKAPMGA
jgi:hypothetical protein